MKSELVQSLRLVLGVTIAAATYLCADEAKPTREAFLGEVLDAKPTDITPKFHNPSKDDSYVIVNEDLLKGLKEEAEKQKLKLLSIIILGPIPGDPLWTSRVVVFIQKSDEIRVNYLVMPHGRITRKAAGLITSDQFKKWKESAIETGALKKATKPEDPKKGNPLVFDSQFLLVINDEEGKLQEFYSGDLVKDEKFEKGEKLIEHYNSILKALKRTYPEKDE